MTHDNPAQVKEIIYPLGATVDVRAISLGDETMSVLEIWGAEYQENDCLLIEPGDRALLEAVAARERCGLQVGGGGPGLGLGFHGFVKPCRPRAPGGCRRARALRAAGGLLG